MMNNLGVDLASAAREMTKAQAKAEIREIVQEELRAAGVLKPKRYVLPMDGTSAWGRDGKHKYAFIQGRNGEGAEWQVTQNAYSSGEVVPSVSKKDYDAAPAWVKAITPVEVRDAD